LEKHFYYKPSGKFSPLFFVYALLIVVAVVPIISAVYIYLSYYTPIVYLKIFVTIGCGIAMGFLMGFAAKLGKARNPMLVLVSTVAVMCIAKYVQWTVYIPLVFYDSYRINVTFSDRFLTSLYLLAEPGTVFEMASVINAAGIWSMGRGMTAVSGVPLFAVWAMEFAAMTGAACMAAREKPRFPFCEDSNAWYGKKPDRVEAGIPGNFEHLKAAIENGRHGELAHLARLAKEKDGGADLLSLLFYKSPSPAQPYYLQINQVKINRGKKKEGKTLLKYIAVDGESAKEITGGGLSAAGLQRDKTCG